MAQRRCGEAGEVKVLSKRRDVGRNLSGPCVDGPCVDTKVDGRLEEREKKVEIQGGSCRKSLDDDRTR